MNRLERDADNVARMKEQVRKELSADRAADCCFCGEPIDARQMKEAWQEYVAFAIPRKAGGTNQMTNKRATGRYCHPICGQTGGADSEQGGLFG